MFGGVVGGAARQPDQAAERGAVDDGAAALRAHLAQLVLHAGPDAAQVDRVHPLEVLGRLVGRVARREHDAGVVERHVEPAERRRRCARPWRRPRLVGHVAGDAERLVARGGQLLGRGCAARPR